MVMNLDKCIGCHTCSVTCKSTWTNRPGAEYMWFNNVETKPGIGYPKLHDRLPIQEGVLQLEDENLKTAWQAWAIKRRDVQYHHRVLLSILEAADEAALDSSVENAADYKEDAHLCRGDVDLLYAEQLECTFHPAHRQYDEECGDEKDADRFEEVLAWQDDRDDHTEPEIYEGIV